MSDKLNTVDDIVSMLDNMMSSGQGHVDVTVNSSDGEMERNIQSMRSLDCAKGDMACSVPTLFEGMDEELRENK